LQTVAAASEAVLTVVVYQARLDLGKGAAARVIEAEEPQVALLGPDTRLSLTGVNLAHTFELP